MRLIDADELLKKLKYSTSNTKEENDTITVMRLMIKEQPTAYDICEVVSQIVKSAKRRKCDKLMCTKDCRTCHYAWMVQEIVDIVDGGGKK